MNLPKLFEIQKVLREHIAESCKDIDVLVEERILALYVELGELANETRCFKYWIQKPPSIKKKILEEYVDGLHFVIELGLDFGHEDCEYWGEDPSQQKIVDQFLELYRRIEAISLFVKLEKAVELPSYEHLLTGYINIGKALGFTWDQIEQAYLEKNEINHKRQEIGY
ncbi:dUTP diphosphatase [Alkalihalophilus marmarensis]|uniref:dUTP diphosphatase n=1 Tax=Alkalihalophilus marmarensis TaxID=521377 RepID=UPI002E249873|nr:dUTP diphosphatase [Alkalihalophilus marmarensis]